MTDHTDLIARLRLLDRRGGLGYEAHDLVKEAADALARHDAEVKAQAWEAGYEDGWDDGLYGYYGGSENPYEAADDD